jgi:geranylgeranyl pyrophosphate synthase
MMGINPLTRYFSDIRGRLSTVANACEWPEFQLQIERHITHTSLPPHVILPIACAGAVGGNPQRALSVATACGLLIVAMRWFDDVQDRDRRESLWDEIGPGRAINMAAAGLSAAWYTLAKDEELPKAALIAFGKYTIELAHGQDIDLKGGVARTLDDYWRLMRGKTGAALALGCEVGALAACPDNKVGAEACGRFGAHMGVLLQILDDLDGTFHPDGIGDLHAGKITLPVLYGLAIDHPARDELAGIVHGGHQAEYGKRVRAILESIDTREFLVWNAFEERRLALACLQDIPEGSGDDMQSGRNALRAFADSLLVGWEDLLERCEQLL